MKFIDLDDNETVSLSNRVVKAETASTSKTQRRNLIAKWDLVDGKLSCKWEIE